MTQRDGRKSGWLAVDCCDFLVWSAGSHRIFPILKLRFQNYNKFGAECISKTNFASKIPKLDLFESVIQGAIRLEICQKIYTTGFFGQKFYTLKVCKLRRFLLQNKKRKCINISYFSRLLLEFHRLCKILTVSGVYLVCVNLEVLRKLCEKS